EVQHPNTTATLSFVSKSRAFSFGGGGPMASVRPDFPSETAHHAAGKAPPFPQTSRLRVCLGIDVGLWTALFRRGAHGPSSGTFRMPKTTLPVARHRGRQHPGRSTRGAFRFSATLAA